MIFSNIYFITSVISIVISLALVMLFIKRHNETARSMSVLFVMAALWSLSDLLSAVYEDTLPKLFWDKFAYIGVVLIPVLWFTFSIRYTNPGKYINNKKIILLYIFPLITIIIVFTNDFHHLFQTKMKYLKVGTFNITNPDFGIWFFLHTFYSYTLFIVGTVLLIRKLIRQPAIYRKQSIIMGMGALAPFLGNIIYTLNILPIIMDLSVFSFSITGIMFFWAMYKYKLFDLVPAAREKVIESMDEIFVVLDSKDRIIDINLIGKKTICKNGANIIGEQFLNAVGCNRTVFEKHMHSVRTNKKLSLEVEGEKKYFNFKINPLFDGKSNINGKFIILHDITSLDETMKKLNESRKAAEEANKSKSAFLASMSHEIRTPLNGIIGMAHLLEAANLNGEEHEYLKSINYSANSLLQIINDILDFSKIEAQKMELEKTTFNLRELLSTTINSFLYMKEEKDINLQLDICCDIPDQVIGDPVRLRQILINLIGNAFKFTPKGSIKISVKKIKEVNEYVELEFSVSDTGIGIPKNKVDNLFESFKQLDSATTRKYGGTGLGLAIVKSLVNLMGGQIKVESEPDRGSIFSFTIPLYKTKNTVASLQEETSLNEIESIDMRILVAEDNKVNQMFLMKLLEKKKCNVDLADNGLKVLEKLKKSSYDLILMDIQMPEMDGYKATLLIRQKEENTGKHIPIVALTANATEEDRKKCFECGMEDYITKPVKYEKLFACILKYQNKKTY